jgi:hypothetical protein
MKTYVLPISKKFPAYHQLAGDDTDFVQSIFNALSGTGVDRKLHTMRVNSDLWQRRFEKINSGEAQLSIRCWKGQPYQSKQETIINLTKDDGIGFETAQLTTDGWLINGTVSKYSHEDFAANDGLSKGDWLNWFKDSIHENMNPVAIIHFTSFRYKAATNQYLFFYEGEENGWNFTVEATDHEAAFEKAFEMWGPQVEGMLYQIIK